MSANTSTTTPSTGDQDRAAITSAWGLAIGAAGTYPGWVKRLNPRRLANIIIRLVVAAVLLAALYANENGLGFAISIGIAVWCVADLALWAYRQSRTS